MMYIILIGYLVIVTVLLASGKEMEHIYDRKMPEESAAVCMYYHNSKFNGKEFWVTLLDLIDRDFYKLENIDGTRYLEWTKEKMFDLDNLGLKPFEKKAVSFVNSLIYEDDRKTKIELELFKAKVKTSPNLTKGMELFYTLLKEEITNTHGFVSQDNKHMKVFLVNTIYMFIAVYFTLKVNFGTSLLAIFMAGLALFVSNVISNTKNTFKSIISIFFLVTLSILAVVMFVLSFGALGLSLFLVSYSEFSLTSVLLFLVKTLYPLLIFVDIVLLKSIRKTKNEGQQKLVDNLLGLRNFMEEFTNTEHREIDYINFLDRYYVLAVALDVNLKYPDYIKSIYDDDTIHTFNSDDLMTELEDFTKFLPKPKQLRR